MVQRYILSSFTIGLGLPIDSHLRDSPVQATERILCDGDLVEKFAHTSSALIIGDEVRKMLVKLGEDVGLPHLHFRLDLLGFTMDMYSDHYDHV